MRERFLFSGSGIFCLVDWLVLKMKSNFREVFRGRLFKHSASKVDGQTGFLCLVNETKEQSNHQPLVLETRKNF